ncbi:methyltransferase domain-containing protein [Rhodohalobacter sp. SW132]|uniref:methyltransferase domain-containing protein n=1 Tax=Rhodohalobacter sp. SW132 TaxID=2293433 RepID=UPI001314AB35|nr:methyltransferase domain-containing protein [Rhodohalobacter sp. SW132]
MAEDLIRLADIQPGERVLDVACGTGVDTRLAAPKNGPSGSITGLDINPGMLVVARSVVNIDALVDWHEAGAEKLPLPDESFDVVLCQASLHLWRINLPH